MARNRPAPGSTIAFILGAHEFPFTTLEPADSFARSASDFAAYLRSTLGVHDEDILDLFDDPRQPGEQIVAIRSFTRSRQVRPGGTADAVFYYCGHGTYLKEDEYVLALRCTVSEAKSTTALRISSLVEVVSDLTRDMRNLVLLDACYAGAALGEFVRMSGDGDVSTMTEPFSPVDAETAESEDEEGGGAVLFCAAGPRSWARAPTGSLHTMFTGAILDTLRAGNAEAGASLSLKEVARLVERRIDRTYGAKGVKPQIHVPVQGRGDLLEGPYFPNPAFDPSRPPRLVVAKEPADRAPGPRPDRPRPWIVILAPVLVAGLVVGAVLLRGPVGVVVPPVYTGGDLFFADAVKAAALPPDLTTFSRLRLPNEFDGRRLKLLAFTSYEGALDDRPWWGLVQPGDLPVPPIISPRPVGPVEKPGIAVSGLKSKNYAPVTIPVVNGAATLTADRLDTVLDVSGASEVFLRFSVRSNTNPQPASVHNCGSFPRRVLAAGRKGMDVPHSHLRPPPDRHRSGRV